MDPFRRAPSTPESPALQTVLARLSQSLDEADNDVSAANNASTSPPPLRSQAEFLMTGIYPVATPSERPCSICVESLINDVVQMVSCGHMFHCTCILGWFQSTNMRRASCPNCREELYEPAPLQASPEDHEYTLLVPESHFLPATPFPATATNFGFLDRQSAQSGAEARTITFAERNAVRLLAERETYRLRRLRELIGFESARPGSPAPGRRTFDSFLSMSDDIRAEGQANLGLVFEPPRPSAETTVAQNEHAREYARNLVRARSMGRPAPDRPRPATSRNIQATRQLSRANIGPPEFREVFASMTTDQLEELVRDDSVSANVRRRYELELGSRRVELDYRHTGFDPYVSPTAQVSEGENESPRSLETTSGASLPYMNMRETRILGPRSPRLTRRETLDPAEVQRREERVVETNRWQERLGRFHAEQATMAAQDPSTIYSNPRMPVSGVTQTPAVLPLVPRTPFRESERVPGPSSTYQSLLSEELRGTRNIDRRRSDLRSQFPLPEGTRGARNRAPASESVQEILARNVIEEPTMPENVLWGSASTRITPRQDVEDQDAVDGSAGNTIADHFDLAQR
jgi:hypothetical protein